MPQLLIETAVVIQPGQINKPASGGYFAEAAGGKLLITLPMTKLNERNLNDRIYSTAVMETAIRRARPAMEGRELLSSVNEHPTEPYVTPGEASHVVIDSWCENNVMYGKWEILETTNGKNLRALVEANVAFGVSIRGLGSIDNQGNILEDYDFLGCDCVGEPSAQLRVRPKQVNENIYQHNKGNIMDKSGLVKYLGEQKVLIENELKADRMTAFQRAAAVENYLSEQHLDAKSLADVYRVWEDIKESTLSEKTSKAALVTESCDSNTDSMYKKVLENRAKQIRAMATGITNMQERITLIKGMMKRTLGSRVALEQHIIVLETRERKLINRNKKLTNEVVSWVKQASSRELAYRFAIKEAARYRKIYKIAVQEAARVLKNKKLTIETRRLLSETAWSFFTDSDYQAFTGVSRPFDKMEPMITEGDDYVAILAGTDDGTEIQIFSEGGTSWRFAVKDWSEANQVMQEIPKSITPDIMTSLGFLSESKSAKMAKKPAKMTESHTHVIDNSGDTPSTVKKHRLDHCIPGWM